MESHGWVRRRTGRRKEETGSRRENSKEGPGGEGFEPRVEEGPRALGRVSGREGCAGVNVRARWPLAGWFARVDKAPDGKALFPGRAPMSLRAEHERHAYYGAFVSNHEDRRVRPTSRTAYPHFGCSLVEALSLSIRSFFEVRTILATLRRAHGCLTLLPACTRLSEV